jgi:hypothetical protein
MKQKQVIVFIVAAIALLAVPIVLQGFGNAWVRIADMALLYVLLALGLNIVVGYAGLLDLGYVAFFAIGAYMYALLASPHLTETFPAFAAMFPNGVHTPIWLVIPAAAGLAGLFGVLLGAPTLRLRGDYLAIVTLGFGEIIRVFMNNLDHPVNITNGPKGMGEIDALSFFGMSFGKKIEFAGFEFASVSLYYYLFFGAGGFQCHHLPPPAALARGACLDGDSRGRDCCQGHGHQHPQSEASGVRHGGNVRRRVGSHVCVFSGIHLARVVQPDGVRHDRGNGCAGRYWPPARCHHGCNCTVCLAGGATLCCRSAASHYRRQA